MRAAPGFLTEREGRFLALVAAGAPAAGTILEIGTFKGKSTVGLATIARRYQLGPVVTVDPHTAPAPTDPDLAGQASSWDAFTAALRAAGVADAVEAHRAYSRELAPGWTRPIRFLWIDGDHTYAGAREDLALFGPHLVPGGIVAFHDVLHAYEGPVRVFVEEVLRSDRFGPAGVCGSIGWAQSRPDDGAAFRSARHTLARRLARLVPLVRDGRRPRGVARLWYQALRAAVPHAAPDPAVWLAAVALPAPGTRGILGHA
jgi:predicted O-methyltransferase YrrM